MFCSIFQNGKNFFKKEKFASGGFAVFFLLEGQTKGRFVNDVFKEPFGTALGYLFGKI
jgi:hypothetical protein